MTIAAIIQARAGGNRFPGKVFADINGKSMLHRIIDRVKRSNALAVIVATPDEEVADHCAGHALVHVGAPEERDDVLLRYIRAAHEWGVNKIVRITADCPLVDPEIIDFCLQSANHNVDYVSTVLHRSLPAGTDVEVVHQDVLERIGLEAKTDEHREHVTLYVRENPSLFQTVSVGVDADYSSHDWRVDWPDDLDFIRSAYRNLGPWASWKEVVAFAGGGDAERVRITATAGSAPGDHPATDAPDAAGPSTVSDTAGSAWYERRYRQSASGGGTA